MQNWIEIISKHERKQYKKCLHYSEYFLTCHYINYGPIIYKVGRPDCRFLPHALYIPHYLSLQPWLQINKISVWYFIFIDSKLCWTDLTKYIFHASSVVFQALNFFDNIPCDNKSLAFNLSWCALEELVLANDDKRTDGIKRKLHSCHLHSNICKRHYLWTFRI